MDSLTSCPGRLRALASDFKKDKSRCFAQNGLTTPEAKRAISPAWLQNVLVVANAKNAETRPEKIEETTVFHVEASWSNCPTFEGGKQVENLG
jgi:hypothetical protein